MNAVMGASRMPLADNNITVASNIYQYLVGPKKRGGERLHNVFQKKNTKAASVGKL